MVSKSVNFLFFLLLTYHSTLSRIVNAETIVDVQKEALKAFKGAVTEDPLGALADWVDTKSHCNWTGIACDHASPSGNVISVSLSLMQLKGEISPFLANLSSLQVLDLSSNAFFGQIPSQLGECSTLVQLQLFNNSLSGPIPPQLGNLRNLESLDLDTNSLNGSIPDEIANCTSLELLYLYNNQLTGAIPSTIGNLSNLKAFIAFANNMVGSIPTSVGNLKALLGLDMSQNRLTGVIPPGIGNLPDLLIIQLFENSLSGTIPPELGNCKNLTILNLYTNQLTGAIPLELGYLPGLTELRLKDNNLTSTIPSTLLNCESLTHLGLSGNELTGTIPSEIGSLVSLQVLTLHSNKLTGTIPSSLANLKNLTIFTASFVFLTGELPSGVGKLVRLNTFHASQNSLTGKIPPEIGNLSSLLILGLHHNKFSGLIPHELSKLSLLQGLSLANNAFEGAVPEAMFGLTHLTRLELQNNKLSGPISTSISKLEFLSILDLSGNLLSGSIPRSMGNLIRMVKLDLSHNNLGGPIPSSMMGSMKSLQMYLNLSYNSFTGSIPDEVGKLVMVQAIDISNNNFSGSIPSAFAKCLNLISLDVSANMLTGSVNGYIFSQLDLLMRLNLSRNQLDGQIPLSIADLSQLSSLDMSENMLSGGIPKNFSSLSSLKHLNLSFNQLEGLVPQTGIFKSLPASSLIGNKALCGTKFLGMCAEDENHNASHGVSRKALRIFIPLYVVIVLASCVLAIIVYKKFCVKLWTVDVEKPEKDFTSAMTLRRFEPKDLEVATDFFSEDRVIGTSKLSTVYKATLEDGHAVAIKKLNLLQFAAESDKCFKREATILSQLRHRNLVKVIGYAWESRKLKALVLEYMENGNLDSVIHDPSMDRSMWTLSKRIGVLVSVAKGLAYLHTGYDFAIVHCDLKPSNILLDKDWEAHVSDFGTARMLGVHDIEGVSRLSSSSAGFEGTIGYIAPEYAYMRSATTKVDIFSFGIVTMELITGRRPTGLVGEDGLPVTLRSFVSASLNDDNKLHGVVDPSLASSITEEQVDVLREVLNLALNCSSPDREDRPDINDVLCLLVKL